MNAVGQIAGDAERFLDDGSFGIRKFLVFWPDLNAAPLPILGVFQTSVVGLSDDGQIAGNGRIDPSLIVPIPFIWRQGAVVPLPDFGGTSFASAFDQSANGIVVGRVSDGARGEPHAVVWTVTLLPDTDGDGVPDATDNCPSTANSGQADADGDGVGDVCDNCVSAPNPDQADADSDGIGDVCESPDERIGLLIADVQDLVTRGVLRPGPQANGLIRKLDAAFDALARGKVRVAVNKLGDFIDQVQGLINAGKLLPADSQALIATAQSIIDQLSP